MAWYFVKSRDNFASLYLVLYCVFNSFCSNIKMAIPKSIYHVSPVSKWKGSLKTGLTTGKCYGRELLCYYTPHSKQFQFQNAVKDHHMITRYTIFSFLFIRQSWEVTIVMDAINSSTLSFRMEDTWLYNTDLWDKCIPQFQQYLEKRNATASPAFLHFLHPKI
jgi:hypothetical protein